MLLHPKERRLPAFDLVAFGAFPFAHSCLELALVWILGMAVDALRKRQLFFEIAVAMALVATDLGVRPEQRILRLRVIELLLGHIHFFPARCTVAGLAGALERALMGVRVAGDARVELEAGVLHRSVGAGREVALFAGHLGVRAGQGILCLGMIELLGLLPVLNVVATLAVRAELSFVGIVVAGRAILGQPDVGFREVFFLDQGARCRCDVRGHVALFAGDSGVLINQRVTRLPVIELFDRRLPMNEVEILTVMFQVTAHAVPAIGIFHSKLGVKTLVDGKALGNLFMTLETFECGRTRSELVAGVALR